MSAPNVNKKKGGVEMGSELAKKEGGEGLGGAFPAHYFISLAHSFFSFARFCALLPRLPGEGNVSFTLKQDLKKGIYISVATQPIPPSDFDSCYVCLFV